MHQVSASSPLSSGRSCFARYFRYSSLPIVPILIGKKPDSRLSNSKPLAIATVGLAAGDIAWNDLEARTGGRTKVVAVWDAVAARAEVVERENDRRDGDRFHRGPTVYPSITKLAERKALKAAVVLNAGWTNLWSARRLADEQLPTLWLADWPSETAWAFKGIGRDLIVPGLRLRVCPATLRLRELVATEIGPIDHINISVGSTHTKWELIDWAANVTNSPIVDTEQMPSGQRFHHKSGVVTDVREDAETAAELTCESGRAAWSPPGKIAWQSKTASDDTVVNTAQDRDAVTVMLDLFFRRVIGGLIPVPSVDDVERAVNLAAD